MNSEKVKEIKKALECCSVRSGKCDQCSFIKKGYDCDLYLLMDVQTYINELESENETIKLNIQETEKVSFNINQMNGNLIIENQTLKDRIAELEKELETRKEEVLHLQEYGKKLIMETELKQFVEGLKEKSFYIETIEDTYNVVELSTVYATLKEYVK